MRELTPKRHIVCLNGVFMEIQEKQINELKPYKRNPRKNEAAVEYVANSIKEFGFKVPIVIDKSGVIVCGHTRYKAAQRLKLKTVPCIIADDLTDEQIKAFRLADNKVSEKAEWDFDLLGEELDGIFDIDMEEFDFEPDIDILPKKHEQYKEKTQEAKENILNLAYAQYDGLGKYDIPEILPVYSLPKITEWIGFNYVLSDKASDEEKLHKGVHFFIDDYQFERIWNNPDLYIEKLLKYGCVLSPDFSPYGDMPQATQIFNHYRKHWIAAYMQANGVTVVPTIRASTDPRSFEWYLDGEPKCGIVAISTMWVKEDKDIFKDWKREYQTMVDSLHPKKIFIYGKIPSNVKHDNVERIEKFTEKRWSKNDR